MELLHIFRKVVTLFSLKCFKSPQTMAITAIYIEITIIVFKILFVFGFISILYEVDVSNNAYIIANNICFFVDGGY